VQFLRQSLSRSLSNSEEFAGEDVPEDGAWVAEELGIDEGSHGP
jgi:hypothetical protein